MSRPGVRPFPFAGLLFAIVGPVLLIAAIAYATDRADASASTETPPARDSVASSAR